MIVTASRQDIDVSLSRIKTKNSHSGLNRTYKSLSKGRTTTEGLSLFSVISPFMTVFLFSLSLFLFILGTELPYKQRYYHGSFRNLALPGETALNKVDIKTLRAETPVLISTTPDTERIVLWDVPFRSYRMSEYDRISSVSQRYGISISTILSFNGIDSIRHVKEGDPLMLPEVNGILYHVDRGETVDSIINKFGIDKSQFILYNPYISLVHQSMSLKTGQEVFLPEVSLNEEELRSRTGQLYIFPVKGRIEKPYGEYRDSMTQIVSFHNGIDIKGEVGDPVRATFTGIVISAGFNNSYGNFIVLDHRNGYKSLYAHLSDISVRRNDKVLQGEVIGLVGKTGYAPTAHLHFSLFKGKKSVDPMDYLH